MATELDKELDALLNTTLDELKPAKIEDDKNELVEVKKHGVGIDYHHDLQSALKRAAYDRDISVYRYNGATKRMVAGTEVPSPVRGNKPNLKGQD